MKVGLVVIETLTEVFKLGGSLVLIPERLESTETELEFGVVQRPETRRDEPCCRSSPNALEAIRSHRYLAHGHLRRSIRGPVRG